ncbi:hypothetical protein NECAME_18421, partial [Necator americanus]
MPFDIVAARHAHEEIALRIRQLDAAFREAQQHALVELTLHAPARRVLALNLPDERHGRAIHLIDAPVREVAENAVLERVFLADLGADILERVDGALQIRAMRDLHLHRRIADAAIRVVHGRHRTERHGVERAVAAAQAHGADREKLDRARDACHRHPVAHLHGIFRQQEDAGDEVLHELLRAKAERHAEDTRARNQRRGVHAELRERGEPDHDKDRNEQRGAEHRQERAQARGAHEVAGVGPRVQAPFGRAVRELPDRDSGEDGDHDSQECRTQHMPDRCERENACGTQVPDVQQQVERHDPDRRDDAATQRRVIAIRTALAEAHLLLFLAQPEHAAQCAEQHDRAHARGKQNDERESARAQQRRVAAAQIERPDEPERQDHEERNADPDVGEPLHEPGIRAVARGGGAHGIGDGAAQLQDDHGKREVNDQRDDLHEREMRVLGHAERHRAAKRPAHAADHDDAHEPALRISGPVVGERHEAQRGRAGREQQLAEHHDHAADHIRIDDLAHGFGGRGVVGAEQRKHARGAQAEGDHGHD